MSFPDILLTILPPYWPKIPPMGLGYLQSFLEKKGVSAPIFDVNNLFYNLSRQDLKKEWLVSCNVYLENNILDIIRKNNPQDYRAAIERFLRHDVIGFSCFRSNFKATFDIARTLKSRRKDIRLVFGGPEITRQFFKGGGKFSRQILQCVDFLVVGEGERPLYEYLKGPLKKTAEFRQLKDFLAPPFPVYKGLSFNDYPGRGALSVQFSRGCVRGCRFCSERLLYKGFRVREAEGVIEEIGYHKERNKIERFVFYDSMLNADSKKLEDLCAKIIDNFGAVNWEAQMAVRPDIGEGLLKKMKQSGCYNLFVGLESGSENTLRRMNKGFSAPEAAAFFQKLNQAGLFFGISIITGYPGETEADFKESLDFVIRNKKFIPKIEQVNPFVYYDGTDTDKNSDYRENKTALERMDIFVSEIKSRGFKYTNAFLGNLVEKNA